MRLPSVSVLLSVCLILPFQSNGQCLDHGQDGVKNISAAIPIRIADHRTALSKQHWVRIGQCQIQLDMPKEPNVRGLWVLAKPDLVERQVASCLQAAVKESVNVLVFPELTLSLDSVGSARRDRIIAAITETTRNKKMIVVAGSFYDDDRHNRLVLVGPDWIEAGDKIRQSRFEVSPAAGKGMQAGSELLVLRTDYGNFAVFTCVDLISDEVQFEARRLATAGEIDVMININHNPAAWEFLIEANSIVRRHPVFVTITNATVSEDQMKKAPYDVRCWSRTKAPNVVQNDSGYCYGHSAVFASLPSEVSSDIEVPRQFQAADGQRELAYDQLVGDLGSFREGLLVYELNMWMNRVPANTNAPDQGYPPIRNIHCVTLEGTPDACVLPSER
jgi:predicted amidohydrolase